MYTKKKKPQKKYVSFSIIKADLQNQEPLLHTIITLVMPIWNPSWILPLLMITNLLNIS